MPRWGTSVPPQPNSYTLTIVYGPDSKISFLFWSQTHRHTANNFEVFAIHSGFILTSRTPWQLFLLGTLARHSGLFFRFQRHPEGRTNGTFAPLGNCTAAPWSGLVCAVPSYFSEADFMPVRMNR